jgi:transcriptional regulator with XRE-family HTH domain
MSDQSRHVLDVQALAAAVETVARHRGISNRVVAAETGLSASTITRLSQGQKPDADGLVTLLAWLKADAAAFAAEREEAIAQKELPL